MELPVAPQQHQPDAATLVRAIRRADVILARTAAEETELSGATAYTNPARPGVHMANFAAEVRVPEGQTPQQVVDEVEEHFQHQGVLCHALVANDSAWSPALVQTLEARGYVRSGACDVCLLGRYVPPTIPLPPIQIIPARSLYPQLREFHRRAAREQEDADETLAEQLTQTRIDHLDEPRLEVFCGRIDQAIAGLVAIVTLGNIGVIDDVYTAPAFRGRGVATRLLDYAIDHCARAMFQSVILEVRQSDAPARRLYESLGFCAVASHHKYVRG
ncbi:MAG: GNAT family N-acetyltransferase [Phycisphaeraceae bacterium]